MDLLVINILCKFPSRERAFKCFVAAEVASCSSSLRSFYTHPSPFAKYISEGIKHQFCRKDFLIIFGQLWLWSSQCSCLNNPKSDNSLFPKLLQEAHLGRKIGNYLKLLTRFTHPALGTFRAFSLPAEPLANFSVELWRLPVVVDLHVLFVQGTVGHVANVLH